MHYSKLCHLSEDVEVPEHQCVLGDHSYRVAILQKHFKALPRQLQLPLNRLVAVCVS